MRNEWIPAMMMLAALTAGCSETQPMAPEGTARTEVVMRGDGGAAEPASNRSGTMYRAATQGEMSGSIDVRARVSIRTESGSWVALTSEAMAGTVAASGSAAETLLARADVEATSYNRVRVEFEEVRGSLNGGLSIGGSLVGGELHVQTGGDGKVVVERDVHFTANGSATTRLVIDLRASEWMAAESEAEGVAEAAFAGAVVITASQS